MSPPGRVPILGVPVNPEGMDEALACCEDFLSGGGPRQVITANPLMLLAAEKDAALAGAFRAADLVLPDGAGLVLAAALQGRRIARGPGIELMERLCERAVGAGRRVFFLGSAPGVAEAAAETLRRRFPGLKVAGARHGYFSPEEEPLLLDAVRAARPDLLFVALSTPFQDAWIHRNLTRLGAKLAMGVGGSFDVLAGRLRRAPRWMAAAGLEWLFRLIQEPSRWRRMLSLPVFLARALLPRFRCYI